MTGEVCQNDEEKHQIFLSGMVRAATNAGSRATAALWLSCTPAECYRSHCFLVICGNSVETNQVSAARETASYSLSVFWTSGRSRATPTRPGRCIREGAVREMSIKPAREEHHEYESARPKCLALHRRSGSGAHWNSGTSVDRAFYPGSLNCSRYLVYFPWMVSLGDSNCLTRERLKGFQVEKHHDRPQTLGGGCCR